MQTPSEKREDGAGSGSSRGSEAAANAFLQAYLTDKAKGEVGSLADYQARFPGHADTIAREFAALSDPASAPEPLAPVDLGPLATSPERVGPYRLVREIGRGGQGSVWEGEDTRIDRRVAVKVLSSLSSLSPELVERFRREAELASRLDHPGICTVYESDVADGVPYVAMRLVEGETLSARVRRQKANGEKPDVASLLALGEAVARALHAAHDSGVVHRDVKPGNLMITPDGSPVVLDFGLARDVAEGGVTLTQSGDVFGTPAYMSPEQIDGARNVDARTDVYSLTATLYEALTHRTPFSAPSVQALYHAILGETPERASRLNPKLPRDLDVVLATGLEKHPDHRYATALDLANDLAAVRESRSVAVRPPGTLRRLARWARREPALATLLTLLVVALAATSGLGGFLVASQPEIEAGTEELDRRALETLQADVFSNPSADGLEARLEALVGPDSPEAAVTLAWLQLSRNDFEATLATTERFVLEGDRARALRRIRAAALEGLARDDESRAILDELGEPRGTRECVVAGTLVLRANPADATVQAAALPYFERATLLADRPSRQALELLIRSLPDTDVRRFAAADALEEYFPDSAFAWFYVGVAHTADAERAKAAFRRANELDPTFAQPYVSLSILALVEGDEEGSRELFEAGLAATPVGSEQQLSLLLTRLRLLGMTARHTEAVDVSFRVLELAPDHEEALLGQARAFQALGEIEAAREPLERILARDPQHREAQALFR